jgi:D-serine deaminase-like pyridoxal phosphate-dependent protein
MASISKTANVRLRPHCKTHASLNIARWLREEADVTCITVSSLSMAEYFASEWNDITIAFPVNILEMDTINNMLCVFNNLRLNLLVENTEAVEALESSLSSKVGIYIKIDVGYGRTGIPADETSRINPILKLLKLSARMQFLGFLTHAGHSYHCRSAEEVYEIYKKTSELMLQLKQHYLVDFPGLQLSMGDTPCCSVVDPNDLQIFDEMRPGNFVFYDLEQAEIGSCALNNIAVAVACPIVAKHADRRELTLYGGGVHFSKEGLLVNINGCDIKIHGRAVHQQDDTWGDVIDGMYIRSLSQEHGIMVVPCEEILDNYNATRWRFGV